MRHSGTRSLFDYWNRRRGDRTAPLRSEIAPHAIAPLLPATFIVDAANRPASFRLAGTRLCSIYGRELTGDDFRGVFTADDRRLADRLLDVVCDAQAIVVLDLFGQAEVGRTLSMEMIVLPLGDDAKRVLGAIHTTTDPVWVGAYPIAPAEILGARILDPERELISLDNRLAPSRPSRTDRLAQDRRSLRVVEGNAAMAARFRHATRGDRPPLRVLDGGRDRPR